MDIHIYYTYIYIYYIYIYIHTLYEIMILPLSKRVFNIIFIKSVVTSTIKNTFFSELRISCCLHKNLQLIELLNVFG